MGSKNAVEDGALDEAREAQARNGEEPEFLDILTAVKADDGGPFLAGKASLDEAVQLIKAGDERVINYTVGMAEGYAAARDVVLQLLTEGTSAQGLVAVLSKDALKTAALADRVQTGFEAEAITRALESEDPDAYDDIVAEQEREFEQRSVVEAVEAIKAAIPEVGESLEQLMEMLSGAAEQDEKGEDEGDEPAA